ncbi:MAG: CoA transferase, partial [Promethearchaeia archaeon]
TKDNKFLTIGAIEMKFWHQLCEALDRDDLKLKQNKRGVEREPIFQELQKEFLKKTQAEWLKIFQKNDTCVMPVKSFAQACEDPQIKAREMVVKQNHPKFSEIPNVASPINYSRTPLKIRSLAPKTGKHTIEILESLNYSEEEIKELKKKKII